MNLRDFQYILAVAETRHFGRAAERCFVTQPTLSGQIKKLENDLGVTIFERTNRSVEVTPIGEAVLTHARLALEQASAIKQVARAHQDPLAGPLRIGAIPTLSPYLMPWILVPLKRTYPQLKPILFEELTDHLLSRLRNHDLDVALLATPTEDPDLVSVPLFDEPFWLAHPREHPICNKDEITNRDLEDVDLLLLSEGHCLTEQVMEVCHLAERPQTGEMADVRAASLETLLQLVGAGFGCTLVPALAIRGGWMTDSGIIARKLEPPGASRRISLVFRRSFPRREAIRAFGNIVLEHLPNTVHRLEEPPKATR